MGLLCENLGSECFGFACKGIFLRLMIKLLCATCTFVLRQDDEIADDETLEAPPALKDLDVTFGTSSRPAGHGGQVSEAQSTQSESSGSYGARPIRERGGASGGRGGAGRGGGGDDEFDF